MQWAVTLLGASLALVGGKLGQLPPVPTSNLPNPFSLNIDQFRAGNPLAVYAEQLKREKEYLADPAWPSGYWQARGTVASVLGDILEAERDWDKAVPFDPGDKILTETRLARMHPEDAISVISREADTHSWIMIGEEHMKPQTRSILPAVLRALWAKGFRTLAVETFADNAPDLAKKQGYVSYTFGTYTADPVFAAGLREAMRLGYRLVAYESRGIPKNPPANDPMYAQNFREDEQAENLKTRIFDKDPQAKVLVWAGRGHVGKVSQADEGGKNEWRTMASALIKKTGIDPFSVYLPMFVEASDRTQEQPLYKWATDRGLVKKPTIFVDKDGKPFGTNGIDAYVFFPRTTIWHGRPNWLMTEIGRHPVEIPKDLVRPSGLQVAQVFGFGLPVTAVPVDQIVIRPGDPIPDLMLPPRGRYWIRVIDPEGKENGRKDLRSG